MKVEQIKTFIEELDRLAQISPLEAWEFFQKNWLPMEPSSKEIIRILLNTPYIVSLFSPDKNLDNKIYYAAILNMANKPTEEERELEGEPIAKLVLKKGVDLKQIAKIFYKLKAMGYILNSKEQIADAMATIFNMSPDTAYTYITDASRLEDTDDLI